MQQTASRESMHWLGAAAITKTDTWSGVRYYAAPTMHQMLLAAAARRGDHRRARLRLVGNAAGPLLPSLAQALKSTFWYASFTSLLLPTNLTPKGGSGPPERHTRVHPMLTPVGDWVCTGVSRLTAWRHGSSCCNALQLDRSQCSGTFCRTVVWRHH